MPPRNRAAWLKTKQAPELVIEDVPYPQPGPKEIVIRNEAAAINPIEVTMQKFGILIEKYPVILGSEVAGVVEEVGSELKDTFKPGDRVIGNIGRADHAPDPKYCGYQEYMVLRAPMIAKVPDHIALTEAVVLPVGISTGVSCLFEDEMLGLELPPGKAGQGKTLLIWGASSAIGLSATQLATAAGYEVYGVASAHNHDLIKSLGAAKCFDRGSENVIDQVVSSLTGKDVVGAYDCVSKEETLQAVCEILHRSGGRKLIAAVLPFPEGTAKHDVDIKTNFFVNIEASGKGAYIWQKILEPGLASGAIQCKPDAEIVGSGLESLQTGIDRLAQGVSAKKIVVTLNQ